MLSENKHLHHRARLRPGASPAVLQRDAGADARDGYRGWSDVSIWRHSAPRLSQPLQGISPTQISWLVGDIKAEVAALRGKGIEFVEFDVPGVKTEGGISQSGPAVWTAYFRGPDGNLLGLTQIG